MKKVEVLFKTSIILNNKLYKKGAKYLLLEKDAQFYVNKGFATSDSLERFYQEKRVLNQNYLNFEEILITGSIGDWLTVQYFLPNLNIKRIYLATQSTPILQDLLPLFYPKAEIIEIYNDWTTKISIKNKDELTALISIPGGWDRVKDLSIDVFFPEVNQGYWKYEKSCPLFTFKEESRHILPEKYVVIMPESEHKYWDRDFNKEDWQNTKIFLEKNDLKGVILNSEKIKCSKEFINLSGKTTFLETLDILEKGIGYIGIDSCLSVIAAKLPYKYFKLKTNNKYLIEWKHIYYAPKRDFRFIQDKI